MQITNGTVERTYKPGDYESRKVALSFNIDPGEDVGAVVAHVASLAEHHARMQPGQPAPIVVPPPAPAGGRKTKPAVVSVVTPPADAFAAPETPTGGQTSAGLTATNTASPSDTSIEADVARVEAGLNAVTGDPFATSAAPAPATNADVGWDTSAAALSGTSQSGAVGDPVPLSGSGPKHTTKALQDACADKIAKIADLPAKQAMVLLVKKLRADFTGDPVKGCEAIPVERRADFLAQLAALQ